MGILSKLKGVFYDEIVEDEEDNTTDVTRELNKVNNLL